MSDLQRSYAALDAQRIADLEQRLAAAEADATAQRERVRVLREALEDIREIASTPPVDRVYYISASKALATTAPEAGEDV